MAKYVWKHFISTYMHPMNHSSNFHIGNKCVNLCKFCESDFGVIIEGKWLQMIGIY